jgi:hypothetical protein
MNGIAILALTLGLVSVIVTLKYLKLYENLSRNINKLSATCGTYTAISKIGDSLKLSKDELETRINQNRDSIAKLLSNKLETFSNYSDSMFSEPIVNRINIKDSIYIDSVARDIDITNLSPYIISPTKPIQIPHSYEKELRITKDHIDSLADTLPIVDQKPIKKDYVNSDYLKYNFIKDNWCLVNHEDKGYCFSVGNNTSCPGNITNSRASCDYYN